MLWDAWGGTLRFLQGWVARCRGGQGAKLLGIQGSQRTGWCDLEGLKFGVLTDWVAGCLYILGAGLGDLSGGRISRSLLVRLLVAVESWTLRSLRSPEDRSLYPGA